MSRYSLCALVTTHPDDHVIVGVRFQIRDVRTANDEHKDFGDGAALAYYNRKRELLAVDVAESCPLHLLIEIAGDDAVAREFLVNAMPCGLVLR